MEEIDPFWWWLMSIAAALGLIFAVVQVVERWDERVRKRRPVPRQSALRWICADCAANRGWMLRDVRGTTWHQDVCDGCHRWCAVTEPRDFDIRSLKERF